MDFATPLQSLAPTVDAVVLSVLAGTESNLSQTQVHRLAGRGSRTGVALALDRLAAQGVVLAEPAAYGSLFRLNRGHVLAPVVLAAQRAREEFLERMRRRCEEFPDSVVSVALYGSVARREAGPESDVDVLFVVEGDAADDDPEIAARIQSLETDVLAWSGNRMQPLVESDAHLERLVLSNEPIVAHWSNEALTLHGRDLSALIREFARQGEAK